MKMCWTRNIFNAKCLIQLINSSLQLYWLHETFFIYWINKFKYFRELKNILNSSSCFRFCSISQDYIFCFYKELPPSGWYKNYFRSGSNGYIVSKFDFPIKIEILFWLRYYSDYWHIAIAVRVKQCFAISHTQLLEMKKHKRDKINLNAIWSSQPSLVDVVATSDARDRSVPLSPHRHTLVPPPLSVSFAFAVWLKALILAGTTNYPALQEWGGGKGRPRLLLIGAVS